MDEYLPEKFKKLVGPTFANKAELKAVHPDYYKKTKVFTMTDQQPARMISMEEKEQVLGKLLHQGGIELSDEQMRDILDKDMTNVSQDFSSFK